MKNDFTKYLNSNLEVRADAPNWKVEEITRAIAKLDDATYENGIMRWNSNGKVPPEEFVALAIALGRITDEAKNNEARSAEIAAFLADYRYNYTGPTDEERFEARAAHGAGVELVNAVTGHRWTT